MPEPFLGILTVVGRILLCTVFLLNPVHHSLTGFREVARMMREDHYIPLSEFFLALSTALMIVGSISIIFGYKAKIGALLLMFTVIPSMIIFHSFWFYRLDGEMFAVELKNFLENLAILGALILISLNGPGALSFDEHAAALTAEEY